MSNFTELETAVLHAIFKETPEIQDALERQLEAATVVERENTGAGFFTTIAIQEDVAAVSSASPLGREVGARVGGVNHGMGFLVFMENGRMRTLEGFTYADSTADLDLEHVDFEVLSVPEGSAI